MTGPGNPGDDLAQGTQNGILQQAGLKMNRYLIRNEETSTGFSGDSPDLPRRVAAGATRVGVEREMHDAIEFHVEGLRLSGDSAPAPRSQAAYCEIAA